MLLFWRRDRSRLSKYFSGFLSDAFEEVTGVRRKILATVDSSVATTTMTRADEDPGDKDMLSGADLLASKLGAKVIKESN